MPRACYLRVHDHAMDALIFCFAETHRNNMSWRLSDLDNTMSYPTEALLFPFRLSIACLLKAVDPFCLLACTLVRRFVCYRQPSDLESGTKCFRLLHLGIPTHRSRMFRPTLLDPTSSCDNMKEVLLRYLYCASCHPSEEYTMSVLSRLALAVTNRMNRTGKSEYFGQVVDYLRRGCRLCRLKDRPGSWLFYLSYYLANTRPFLARRTIPKR